MTAAAISFAFQSITDIETRTVFAYEALVRGAHGEPAAQVFANVPSAGLAQFDHEARITAVNLAGRLGLSTRISLNLLPGSLRALPTSLDTLLEAAARAGVASEQLLIEVTESEIIERPGEFFESLNRYRAHGVRLAIDDFGAGYSGLNLLADFQPDLIKLDMNLVRDIHRAGPRQAIAKGVLQVCDDLGIEVIAEGVETLAEYAWLKRVGIRLFQGYLFGRPKFESLDPPDLP
ncbi:MAG: EAL domain-containing protein [Pseudomonadota bacterium]|nr:EAL domain-containing protein [Pseudomonadota bacterium]